MEEASGVGRKGKGWVGCGSELNLGVLSEAVRPGLRNGNPQVIVEGLTAGRRRPCERIALEGSPAPPQGPEGTARFGAIAAL